MYISSYDTVNSLYSLSNLKYLPIIIFNYNSINNLFTWKLPILLQLRISRTWTQHPPSIIIDTLTIQSVSCFYTLKKCFWSSIFIITHIFVPSKCQQLFKPKISKSSIYLSTCWSIMLALALLISLSSASLSILSLSTLSTSASLWSMSHCILVIYSIYLFIYLYIYLSTYLSIYLSLYFVSTYLSIYLSI